MSALEDRQDATPAIDTPTTGAIAPPDSSLDSTDDLDAIAAVEGNADPARDAALEADLTAGYPAVSDAVAAVAEDDAPLLDGSLEDGIASVFAALQAATHDDEHEGANGALGDDEANDGITFRLLGELDRLWHRAA